MKLVRILMPFIFLFILSSILTYELFYSRPHELPSALIGKPLPEFSLQNIYPSQPALQSSMMNGDVVLLNVWATWCHVCRAEHEMLMKIKNDYHVPMFGLIYKDNAADAIEWLKENGNPYIFVGDDHAGDTAIDLGVYGTPELFVIKQGKIIYRHIGTLDQDTWEKKIYPLLGNLSS